MRLHGVTVGVSTLICWDYLKSMYNPQDMAIKHGRGSKVSHRTCKFHTLRRAAEMNRHGGISKNDSLGQEMTWYQCLYAMQDVPKTLPKDCCCE